MNILNKISISIKRLIDVIYACVGLIFLTPIIIIISMIIWLRIGSPVFFRQKRIGFRGKTFLIYKFRTMTYAYDDKNTPLPDDIRLTRLGYFLRALSIDELPEILNVLKGDMSFVGPRPLLPEYLPLYTKEQNRRHEVKPGITGWAQVNGRNAISWEEKFKLDVWYVDHQSFWLDIKIILMTIVKVFKREGISPPIGITMEKFNGSIE